MRKQLIKILLILLVLPIFVSASSFDSAKKNVSNYCLKIDNEGRYFKCHESLNYGYDIVNKKISSFNDFKNGGLLNESEFNISKSNKINGNNVSSYLAPGFVYWLIDGNDKAIETRLTTTNDAGTRPTEYVKHMVRVSNTGKRENPWVFEDVYKVTLDVANTGGEAIDTVKFVNKNGGTSFAYKTNNGFTLGKVECSGLAQSNISTVQEGIISVSKITQDTNCKMTFEKLTKAKVVYNYYKEVLDPNAYPSNLVKNDTYYLYDTVTEHYKEGTKVSIDTDNTPKHKDISDNEEYFVNKTKGKFIGYATIDNTLVLDIYYDIKNVIDVTANVTGVNAAQSGEKVTLEAKLTNRKNKPVEVVLNDKGLKDAGNKVKDPDANASALIKDAGLTLTLNGKETKTIQYSFTVDEVPGKTIKSQLTYKVKDREKVITKEIVIGIEKIISLVERNNNTPGANVVIVLDISGSMDSTVYDSNNKPDGTRLSHAKAAIQDFIAEAYNDKDNTKIRVTTFGSSAQNYGIIAKDSSTAATLRTSVENITSSGQTRYDLGLQKAYESLFTESGNLKSSWPNNQPVVIFLSDGVPYPTKYIDNISGKVEQLTSNHTDIYTIGYGKLDGTAIAHLEDIATSYKDENNNEIKRFFRADPTNVSSIFSQIYKLVDTLNDRLTTGGYVRISSNAIVNASKPLKIKCGSTELTYNSLDELANSQYGKKDNNIYYVNAAKFNATSKVQVIYFIPDAK